MGTHTLAGFLQGAAETFRKSLQRQKRQGAIFSSKLIQLQSLLPLTPLLPSPPPCSPHSLLGASCTAPFPTANSLSLWSQTGLGDGGLIVNPRKRQRLIVPRAVTSHRGCHQSRAVPFWAQSASDCSPFNRPCPWGPSSRKVHQLQCCAPEHLPNVSRLTEVYAFRCYC